MNAPPQWALCAFCGQDRKAYNGTLGVFLGPLDDGNRSGVGVYVHRHCALWSSEVHHSSDGSTLCKVGQAIRRGRQLRCGHCGERGATLGCRLDRCNVSYHLPCARASGCAFFPERYLIACPRHVGEFKNELAAQAEAGAGGRRGAVVGKGGGARRNDGGSTRRQDAVPDGRRPAHAYDGHAGQDVPAGRHLDGPHPYRSGFESDGHRERERDLGGRARQPPSKRQKVDYAAAARHLKVARAAMESAQRAAAAAALAAEADDDEAVFAAKERRRHAKDTARLAPVMLGGDTAAASGDDGGRGIYSRGFECVGGLEPVIQSLREMVLLPLLHPGLMEKLGVAGAAPPRGILLHGLPGTGKTLVVRALAGEVARRSPVPVALFARGGADVLGKYHGDAERTLRLLFEEARRRAPAIIFLDELDALAPRRSVAAGGSDQIYASVVTTLLALMDGLADRGQVVVIGATNRPDNLDPALRRPGRFDREVAVGLPGREDRAAVLRVHTAGWTPPPAPDLIDGLAEATEGYAGADLAALCSSAVMAALRRSAAAASRSGAVSMLEGAPGAQEPTSGGPRQRLLQGPQPQQPHTKAQTLTGALPGTGTGPADLVEQLLLAARERQRRRMQREEERQRRREQAVQRQPGHHQVRGLPLRLETVPEEVGGGSAGESDGGKRDGENDSSDVVNGPAATATAAATGAPAGRSLPPGPQQSPILTGSPGAEAGTTVPPEEGFGGAEGHVAPAAAAAAAGAEASQSAERVPGPEGQGPETAEPGVATCVVGSEPSGGTGADISMGREGAQPRVHRSFASVLRGIGELFDSSPVRQPAAPVVASLADSAAVRGMAAALPAPLSAAVAGASAGIAVRVTAGAAAPAAPAEGAPGAATDGATAGPAAVTRVPAITGTPLGVQPSLPVAPADPPSVHTAGRQDPGAGTPGQQPAPPGEIISVETDLGATAAVEAAAAAAEAASGRRDGEGDVEMVDAAAEQVGADRHSGDVYLQGSGERRVEEQTEAVEEAGPTAAEESDEAGEAEEAAADPDWLGDVKVLEEDWEAALAAAPKPCSRRDAAAAVCPSGPPPPPPLYNAALVAPAAAAALLHLATAGIPVPEPITSAASALAAATATATVFESNRGHELRRGASVPPHCVTATAVPSRFVRAANDGPTDRDAPLSALQSSSSSSIAAAVAAAADGAGVGAGCGAGAAITAFLQQAVLVGAAAGPPPPVSDCTADVQPSLTYEQADHEGHESGHIEPGHGEAGQMGGPVAPLRPPSGAGWPSLAAAPQLQRLCPQPPSCHLLMCGQGDAGQDSAAALVLRLLNAPQLPTPQQQQQQQQHRSAPQMRQVDVSGAVGGGFTIHTINLPGIVLRSGGGHGGEDMAAGVAGLVSEALTVTHGSRGQLRVLYLPCIDTWALEQHVDGPGHPDPNLDPDSDLDPDMGEPDGELGGCDSPRRCNADGNDIGGDEVLSGDEEGGQEDGEEEEDAEGAELQGRTCISSAWSVFMQQLTAATASMQSGPAAAAVLGGAGGVLVLATCNLPPKDLPVQIREFFGDSSQGVATAATAVTWDSASEPYDSVIGRGTQSWHSLSSTPVCRHTVVLGTPPPAAVDAAAAAAEGLVLRLVREALREVVLRALCDAAAAAGSTAGAVATSGSAGGSGGDDGVIMERKVEDDGGSDAGPNMVDLGADSDVDLAGVAEVAGPREGGAAGVVASSAGRGATAKHGPVVNSAELERGRRLLLQVQISIRSIAAAMRRRDSGCHLARARLHRHHLAQQANGSRGETQAAIPSCDSAREECDRLHVPGMHSREPRRLAESHHHGPQVVSLVDVAQAAMEGRIHTFEQLRMEVQSTAIRIRSILAARRNHLQQHHHQHSSRKGRPTPAGLGHDHLGGAVNYSSRGAGYSRAAAATAMWEDAVVAACEAAPRALQLDHPENRRLMAAALEHYKGRGRGAVGSSEGRGAAHPTSAVQLGSSAPGGGHAAAGVKRPLADDSEVTLAEARPLKRTATEAAVAVPAAVTTGAARGGGGGGAGLKEPRHGGVTAAPGSFTLEPMIPFLQLRAEAMAEQVVEQLMAHGRLQRLLLPSPIGGAQEVETKATGGGNTGADGDHQAQGPGGSAQDRAAATSSEAVVAERDSVDDVAVELEARVRLVASRLLAECRDELASVGATVGVTAGSSYASWVRRTVIEALKGGGGCNEDGAGLEGDVSIAAEGAPGMSGQSVLSAAAGELSTALEAAAAAVTSPV